MDLNNDAVIVTCTIFFSDGQRRYEKQLPFTLDNMPTREGLEIWIAALKEKFKETEGNEWYVMTFDQLQNTRWVTAEEKERLDTLNFVSEMVKGFMR